MVNVQMHKIYVHIVHTHNKYSTCTCMDTYIHIHWRRLGKNIGKTKILGGKVVTTDESMGSPQSVRLCSHIGTLVPRSLAIVPVARRRSWLN